MLSPERANLVRENFLNAGTWHLGAFTFASGAEANNKLEAEVLFQHPQELTVVTTALADELEPRRVRALFGPPNGGQQFAEHVAQLLDVDMIYLEKDTQSLPGEKSFHFRSREDAEKAQSYGRIGCIEDVTTTMTSVAGALELPGLREHTVVVQAIWRRGMQSQERTIEPTVSWLIQEPVPNMITEDSAFYQENQHRAVRLLA